MKNYCRICKSVDLYEFLDLGFTPPADHFLKSDQLSKPEIYYPLKVLMCRSCGLAQLSYTVEPEELYKMTILTSLDDYLRATSLARIC